MKEKIKEILLEKLSYAYCDNCGTENCDDCHRKMQNWSLSPEIAEELSEEILNFIKEHSRKATYNVE